MRSNHNAGLDALILNYRRTTNMAKQMIGIVVGIRDNYYFHIECSEGPAHLRTLNLVPSQMLGATIGDTVRLEYQTTPRSGLWNVVAILPKG